MCEIGEQAETKVGGGCEDVGGPESEKGCRMQEQCKKKKNAGRLSIILLLQEVVAAPFVSQPLTHLEQ